MNEWAIMGVLLALGVTALMLIIISSFRADSRRWVNLEPSEPREPSLDRDKRLIAQGMCPDCEKSELLGGPSGGMSQNVGCNNCLMEFNVHHSFGGLLGVDRTGKMSESRAGTFGISPEEYREIVARVDELDPRDKLDPYFNPDGN